ncbi:hypothetical protein P3X46_011187 [Hevea brasiliensis]|uniref:Uncharacterized protein n=1 Tax=Hevea brasiliensis TaxID=3981 RepID=A0ABQ9MIV3_HEVBR|nr:transcription factor MYB1-like [Hevea brasiliensis]KAJ9179397.1 hypothetical protein P3X46_011187 [Hevea brasiliensis]
MECVRGKKRDSEVKRARERERERKREMGRSPCCAKEGLNRGAWTAIEDKILTDYIKIHGEGNWRNLPKKAGLKRCGKSCRLRWLNYLRPGIKRGNITRDEEDLIIRLHKLLGNRWSLIAGRLPGRTDNEIKNYWNTIIGKRLQNQKFPCSSHNNSFKFNQPQHRPIQKSISMSNANAKKVFWTKASKCSKVVIPTTIGPQNLVHDITVVPPPPSMENVSGEHHRYSEEEENNNNNNNNSSSDLMLDFEMDEQLLSELLNADFSLLNNFDNGAASNTNTVCEHPQLSPDSQKTLLVLDDAMQDARFPFMDSLIESGEFDWLEDLGNNGAAEEEEV